MRLRVSMELALRTVRRRGMPAGGRLTPRERDVVERAMRGARNKEIAYELGIAHATVRVLLHRVMLKLGVQNREELVARLRPPVAIE
jgi:DNA-binding CsgD family transcriptional regulator